MGKILHCPLTLKGSILRTRFKDELTYRLLDQILGVAMTKEKYQESFEVYKK